jgi:prolipoprotein diacylglyceryl transferase
VPTLIATIPPPPFSGFELGPLNVRMYGLLIAIGAFLALRLVVTRYERFGGNPEVAERAALLALLFGLIGSRIGYIIPRYDRFLADPLAAFAIWEGGLVFFGGLAGGALAVIIYVRAKGGSLPAMLDAMAPALPLAQAIGRWGNYFNQELYGRPTDVPWALEVEPPFRRPGFEDAATFHPTFLYESLWNFALVGVLLWIDRRGRLRRGSLLFVYLIGYGIGRAWIEALRIDTVERYFGLSRNNWIALLVVGIGVVGLLWWQRRGPAVDEAPADEPTAGEEADPQPAETDAATAGEVADARPAEADESGASDTSERQDEPDAANRSDAGDAPASAGDAERTD